MFTWAFQCSSSAYLHSLFLQFCMQGYGAINGSTMSADTMVVVSVPGSLCFGLPKGSPLTSSLDTALLTLLGNGVIDQLIRKWTVDLNQASLQTASMPCHVVPYGAHGACAHVAVGM